MTGSSRVFVEHSGKAGDRAEVVPGCVAHVLLVGLGVPHVGPVGRVWGEHGLVLVGQGALQGKVEGKVLPSGVKSLLFQGEQGGLIAQVSSSKDKGKSFLLHHFYLS